MYTLQTMRGFNQRGPDPGSQDLGPKPGRVPEPPNESQRFFCESGRMAPKGAGAGSAP